MNPILGITLGDICGIGPEIVVKAFMNRQGYPACRLLAVGSATALERACKLLGAPLNIHRIKEVGEAHFTPDTIDILDQPDIVVEDAPYGVVCKEGGRSAFMAVEQVIRLAMAGDIDATVTSPLNKEALHLAGYPFSGHTEIYAQLTGTKNYSMMLADKDLRVVHVSTHVSLREACDRVKQQRVYEVIAIAHSACRRLGILKPKIAVAGLNPHSGESGLFGREEIEEIIPAIQRAVGEGILAEGPVPPDTVFSKARGGMYDIVVAMYHDQGHIPLKVLGFVYNKEQGVWDSVSGVNITLGLPIIRASVDHGTAFDQAGKGTATEESLCNAIAYGVLLAESKER